MEVTGKFGLNIGCDVGARKVATSSYHVWNYVKSPNILTDLFLIETNRL